MAKNSEKTRTRDAVKAARVKKVNKITGVSERQIYRVINGEQENEEVVEVFMELTEREEQVFEDIRTNRLLEAVKDLVPFN